MSAGLLVEDGGEVRCFGSTPVHLHGHGRALLVSGLLPVAATLYQVPLAGPVLDTASVPSPKVGGL